MFSKKSISSSLFIVLLFLFVTKVVAEDDDDNIAGEIATDLLIGAVIAICEGFIMCKLFMVIMCFIGTIMILLALCSGEITCADICNSRNARRGFTTGAGYGLTRSFRR